MTKKSEKENDRIQISAFWLSERQSPYAYNFLKKNDLTHRGEQLSIIRSAITTGLVLNNLFPELSSFINGLNERLTAADLNRFFNDEFKKSDLSNEQLKEQISFMLDSKFNDFLSKINNGEIHNATFSSNSQIDVSHAVSTETVKDQRLELMTTELGESAMPEIVETLSHPPVAKQHDPVLKTNHGTASVNEVQSDNLVPSGQAQKQGVTRKQKKRANANLANLAK
ncbi:ParR [Salmonella enterica subsp. enterica]|uniref:ParR n=1 Tax=Salmonella enterica I TaxID=59201 RepID=A0A379Y434_SALET|nr:ParR [Salmonella enterica subsp. enterica]